MTQGLQFTALVSLLLAVVHGLGIAAAAEPVKDELACGQEPGNRFYWVERAFCDLSVNGPEKAQGVIIWNHGISGTTEQWRYPVPPAFRLLQTRGWDVIAIKRHNQGDAIANPLGRAVQRTLEEAKTQHKLGYRKIVAAGQSFGGYISLDTVDTSPDFFAVVAMAPGVRPGNASGRLDAAATDRILQRAKTQRIALVFPKHDAMFGNVVRGESANSILVQRGLPYLLLDETAELIGHGGATGGRFALRYGLCLAEFLTAPDAPSGRFTCPAVDEWRVVRELLLRSNPPRPVRDAAELPVDIRSLTGWWYGVMGDTLILLGLVDGGRLAYRWLASRDGSAIVSATVKDGRVRGVLANKAVVEMTPTAQGASLSWTSSDGRTLLTTLARGRDEE